MINVTKLDDYTPEQIDKLMAESNIRLARLGYLKEYNGPDRVVTSVELYDELQKEPEHPRIDSTWKGLQAVVNGWEPGELVVVSGATGEGKTTVLQSLSVDMVNQGVMPVWFSFEVNMKTFLSRFSQSREGIPIFALPRENADMVTFQWIVEKIEEAQVKHNAQVVCIDHLHYLLEMKDFQNSNSSLMIGAAMRELKKLAIRLNVVIFLIAHTTKIEEGERPKLSDLRDSSFIAQEADQVYMIHSERMKNDPDVKTGKSMLYIKKNRREGETGMIMLTFDGGLLKPYAKPTISQ